jgi:predicted membrane protein
LNTSHYINFFTAGIVFIIGLLILLGVLYPQSENPMIVVFAIVLMVYGVYRFINTYSKIKLQRLDEKRIQMEKEKEKFLRER